MEAEHIPDTTGTVSFTRLEEIPHAPDQLLRNIVKGGLAIVLASGAITVSAHSLHTTDRPTTSTHPRHFNK